MEKRTVKDGVGETYADLVVKDPITDLDAVLDLILDTAETIAKEDETNLYEAMARVNVINPTNGRSFTAWDLLDDNIQNILKTIQTK